jgi:hypothetical protein
MLIQRISLLTGKQHSMEIPITEEQMEIYERGVLIHRAAPNLTADQREFIISGITPEEWNETFKQENE